MANQMSVELPSSTSFSPPSPSAPSPAAASPVWSPSPSPPRRSLDPSDEISLDDLTDGDIVERCRHCPLLTDPQYSNRVVRISSKLVVKFGWRVLRTEFDNLEVAFQRLDPSIVRVPQPHRFFQHESTGYLVMDFVEGQAPTTQQALAIAPRLAQILTHIHSMQGEVPGSLGGGPINGVMWPDHDIKFKNVQELECWFTTRAMIPARTVVFNDLPFVMCHMDFTPRNMIFKDDTITLIDWESAGYFPRIFDYISYEFSRLDMDFCLPLQSHLAKLTDREKQTAEDVVLALQNCIIYYL